MPVSKRDSLSVVPVVIGKAEQIRAHVQALRDDGKVIGFVPTMGALHKGHLSLVEKAVSECDYVVVSIFVNPTQFNDPKDFERYPRTVERDIALLTSTGCQAVFVPESGLEIYPDGYKPFTLDLGNLALVMEGKHRPGHFDGVVNVVHRLFSLVMPHRAYFGLKDYQQFRVVEKMVEHMRMDISLIGVPTSRSTEGLALSSRNELLSADEKKEALAIIEALREARIMAVHTGAEEIKAWVRAFFEQRPAFNLEYIEISEPKELLPLSGSLAEIEHPLIFIAARLGKVRLIDNLYLK